MPLLRTVNDTMSVSDQLRRAAAWQRLRSDAIIETDFVVASQLAPLSIVNARALAPTRVRLDFSTPALINQALSSPASYTIVSAAPGAAVVSVLAVRVPSGQVNPTYVELEVTEHTNLKPYAVAISSALRGTEGQIGKAGFFAYTGVGQAPTIKLVIATSPTEVQVHFTEPIVNNGSVYQLYRWLWNNGLATIAVKSVVGNIVTLQTTPQAPGAFYQLDVVGANPQGIVADIVEMTDALRTSKAFHVRRTDAVAVTDKITRSMLPFVRGNAADAISVSDSIRAARAVHIRRNDTIAATDSIARVLYASKRSTTADAIVVSDSLRIAKTLHVRRSDAVVVTDAITRSKLPFMKGDSTDTIAVTDSRARVMSYGRRVTDTISPVVESLTVADFKPQIIMAGRRPGPLASPEVQLSKNAVTWQPAAVKQDGRIARAIARLTGIGAGIGGGVFLLVGDGGLCLRSVDRGYSWTTAPITFGANAYAVWSDYTRWWFAFSGSVYCININATGSLTFYEDLPGAGLPNAGTFYGYPDANYGAHLVVGTSGSIWTRPWRALTPGEPNNSTPFVLRTADAGYTGAFRGAFPLPHGLYGDSFWTYGDQGEVQYSYDFGETWARAHSDSSLTFYGGTVWIPDGYSDDPVTIFVGSGPSGAVVLRMDPYTGVTLSAPIPGSVAFRSVAVHSNYFVAVGDNGLVATCLVDDSSNTWTVQTPANTGGTFVGDPNSDLFAVISSY